MKCGVHPSPLSGERECLVSGKLESGVLINVFYYSSAADVSMVEVVGGLCGG